MSAMRLQDYEEGVAYRSAGVHPLSAPGEESYRSSEEHAFEIPNADSRKGIRGREMRSMILPEARRRAEEGRVRSTRNPSDMGGGDRYGRTNVRRR